MGVTVDLDLVTVLPAEEFVHRHVEQFPLDVVTRGLDRRERRLADAAGAGVTLL